jgi:hypothetical protein
MAGRDVKSLPAWGRLLCKGELVLMIEAKQEVEAGGVGYGLYLVVEEAGLLIDSETISY